MKLEFDRESALARWGGSFSAFTSLDSFCRSELRIGVQAVDIGEATLFLYYRPKTSRNLIVHFSGAMVRAPDRHLPYLAGLDLTADLDSAFLAVDDPALQYNDDLALGWHIGTRDFSLLDILPRVIQHVASQTASDNIILTGGSGGGFASLLYGSMIPSTVIAFNPQTDIFRYSPAAYKKYAVDCFGWDGTGDPKTAFPSCAITSLVDRLTAPPKGVYLQNKSDWHTDVHALPLIAALGGRAEPVNQQAGGLSFVFGDWGAGHAPLPKHIYKLILKLAIDGEDAAAIAATVCRVLDRGD